MAESKFQAELIQDLQEEGCTCLKLDPGTGTIPKGWPDLLILWPGGRFTICEVKDFDGTVSPQQRRHVVLLRLSGFEVCFVDPRPDFCYPIPMTYRDLEDYEPPRR